MDIFLLVVILALNIFVLLNYQSTIRYVHGLSGGYNEGIWIENSSDIAMAQEIQRDTNIVCIAVMMLDVVVFYILLS